MEYVLNLCKIEAFLVKMQNVNLIMANMENIKMKSLLAANKKLIGKVWEVTDFR